MTEGAGCTVLVVDDDPGIRESIVGVLADEGYTGIEARDGLDALARLRTGDAAPCLILLDLMMPGMDGMQFRDEQLRDPQLATIPVVVISADASTTVKASALGAAGVLRKPIDLFDLLRTIQRYC